MKSIQKGFTAIEVIIVMMFIALICGLGAGIWVLCHFISKVW